MVSRKQSVRRTLTGLMSLLLLVLGMIGTRVPFASAAAVPEYGLYAVIPPADDGFIDNPADIAIDDSGNRYVVDRLKGIVKMDANGSYVATWLIDQPIAVAVGPGPDNRIHVLVSSGHVRIFDVDGTPMLVFGEGLGSDRGQFNKPGDLAVGRDGAIYVADTDNHRIQKFDERGQYLSKWENADPSHSSSLDGEFSGPSGIAVDSAGYVYVADGGNNRIQKFEPGGQLAAKWGSPGSGAKQLQCPCRLEVVDVGSYEGVYITDSFNDRVQKIDLGLSDSDAVSFGRTGYGQGYMYFPYGIAVDDNGRFHVADRARVQAFDDAGQFIAQLGGPGEGQFQEALYVAADMAADRDGDIYVSDQLNHRIQKFNASGEFLLEWGSYGEGEGQFSMPAGVAVDRAGDVYVADQHNYRVQKFKSNGDFIRQWGTRGYGAGQFISLAGIAVDSQNYVYVADASTHRIQKFDSGGNYVEQWSDFGGAIGKLSSPVDIAVDASDHVYVVDFGNNRIVKYGPSGPITWGSQGIADGQFHNPLGIAVDASGTVIVTDSGNNRVQAFDADGTFITKWHMSSYPAGIAASRAGDGNVLVTNPRNNTLSIYREVEPLSDLAAVGGNGTAALTFSAPVWAGSVVLEQSVDGGATWNPAVTASPLTAASTGAVATGLTNGTTYQFRLNVTGGAHAGVSNVASATPQAPPPTSGGNGSPPLSSNANLKSLTVGAGTLRPSFDPATTGYEVEVGHEESKLEIVATVADDRSKLRIGGEIRASGEAVAMPLQTGDNRIEIVVTAQDTTKKTYTIDVRRAAPPEPSGPSEPVKPVGPSPEPIPFTDVTGHWAEEQIGQAAAAGIASGYPDGTFRPDRAVTRAEFVAFIARARGWSAASDLPLGLADRDQIPAWAQGYIAQAAKAGFVSGYEDGTFRADRLITRTEAVSVIVRVLGRKPVSAKTGFADDEAIPAWGRGYVWTAADLGVIAGRSGNRFEPYAHLTRAEAVVLVLKTRS